MEDLRNRIKNIVIEEFTTLINNIENDFAINYIRKRYNFLLNQLDENVIANMVFVSSFESKCGNAIEKCAKRIARLKFGDENVPTIINPLGLKHNLDEKSIAGQLIVSDIDLDNGELRGKISAFRASNIATGRGKKRKESGITQSSIKQFIDISEQYKDDKIHTKPVDLAFFDGRDWILMELKAGGDLDSSNAPSNIEKLLTIYTGIHTQNSKIYFSTLYNKNGEGNTWSGAIKKHMAFPEMFLIGKDFWNVILPDSIRFNEFEQIYKDALTEIDLNKHIKNMIEKALK